MKKLLIFLVLIILSACKPKHIETEQGVHCVQFVYGYGVGITCNWEKYNHDTNYGEFPLRD